MRDLLAIAFIFILFAVFFWLWLKEKSRNSVLSAELERWRVGHITATRWLCPYPGAEEALEYLDDVATGRVNYGQITDVRDFVRERFKLLSATLRTQPELSDVFTAVVGGTNMADSASLVGRMSKLILEAELSGFVLTVEQVPREPLAMGNYYSKPSIRPTAARRKAGDV